MRTLRGGGRGRACSFLPAFSIWLLIPGAASAQVEDYSSWVWSARIAINTTASGARISEPQTDFPMLVRLPPGHAAFTQARHDGSDLRFADLDGTPLAYEIERWEPEARKGEIWVKVPKVDANSDKDGFTMLWGHPTAASRSDGESVFAVANVQLATFHLSDKGAASRANSAWPVMPATPVNYDGDESREGVIGRCDSLDGTAVGDHLDLGRGFSDFTPGISVSLWHQASEQSQWAQIFSVGNGPGKDNILMGRESDGTKASVHVFAGTIPGNRTVTDSGMEAGRWRHLALTVSGTTVRCYVDGVLRAQGNTGVEMPKVTRTQNYIGRSPWVANAYWKGKVDEVSIGKGVRSPDWIKLGYETQKPGSVVLSFQPPAAKGLSITAQPRSASAKEGSSVTFSVTAMTSLPLAYQWMKGGLAVAGAAGTLQAVNGSATASLTLPAVTFADTGKYTCALGDGFNPASSEPATLTVTENLGLWPQSMKLTFNTTASGAGIAGATVDVPVPVRLDATRFDFSQASAGGADLRFSDPDGTALPYEVAHWDAAARQAEIWVRVPRVDGNSAADYVTMHWGRAGAAPGSSGSAVFGTLATRSAAWHLNEAQEAPPEAADAAGTYGGQTAGAVRGMPGVLGRAYEFQGGGHRVALPASLTTGLKSFTVTLWARETRPGPCIPLLVCPTLFGGDAAGFGSGDFWIGSNLGRPTLQSGLALDKDDTLTAKGSMADAEWHFIALAYDARSVSLYRDGVLEGTRPADGLALVDKGFDIGNLHWHDGSRSHGFQGEVDAVQFLSTAQPAERIRFHYQFQRAGSTAIAYGSAARQPPPAPLIQPGAGSWTSPLTVTLSSPAAGAALFYTLDGSFPDTTKPATRRYAAPFVLRLSATVTAVAFRDGLFSEAALAAYTLSREMGTRDTLLPGEEGVLPGGIVVANPAGGKAAVVEADTAFAREGFEIAGPLIRATPVTGTLPSLGIPPVQVRGRPASLYRLRPDGEVEWTAKGGATVVLPGAGAFFLGLDVAAPSARLLEPPSARGDSLSVGYALRDNARNLECRLHWWSGAADSTAWAPCSTAAPYVLTVPAPARGYAPLEVRLSVSDRTIASHHPEGASRAVTVARAFAPAQAPIALPAGGAWHLLSLAARPEGPLKLSALSALNGAALQAGHWVGDPDRPGEGAYRILAAEDTLPVGVGVWLASQAGLASLSLPALRSVASDSDGGFPVRLARGWNLVAAPGLRAMPWVATRAEPEAYLQSPVKILRRHTGKSYAEADTVKPWEGYFAFNHGGDTLVRLHASPAAAPLAKAARAGAGWGNASASLLTLGIDAGGGRSLLLGAREWARDGLGVEDDPLPPSREDAAGPRFLRAGRSLETDVVRLRPGEAMAWTLAGGGDLEVARAGLPAGMEAWAAARPGRVKRRLEAGARLPLAAGDTLEIFAGTPAALAAVPALREAREAPAAAGMRLARGVRGPELALSLPGIAKVTVKVWDAAGRRRGGSVRVLGAGWHRLPVGEGLAPGMYWIEGVAAGEGWRERRLMPWSRL